MKLKAFAFVSILGLFVLLSVNRPGHNGDKEKVLLQAYIAGLNQVHYQPVEINDDFSVKVFDLFIDRLDGNKRFFLASDIAKLKEYKFQIDNQVNTPSFEFFNNSVEILDQRINQAQSIYQNLLSKPFNFNEKESIEFDSDKIEWAADEAQIKEYWRKTLKYRTMTRIRDLEEKQNKKKEKGEEVELKSFVALEAEAREKELETHDKWFNRIAQLERKDRMNTFLNSIASIYDPHTSYLPPQEKENFDIGMSGRLEGIGARLQSDGEETKVVSIVPGSASWRQGVLEVNDIILKVGQADEDPIDIGGMRINDVVAMIRGPKDSEVRLTVRKADGTTKLIPIIRDVVIIEEGYAKSTILTTDKVKKKIGYIYLPRFYADFNKLGGKNSGDDIKNEITKLQEEGVKGLILDLRNNGGGSLNDVIQMAGLFIEKGPVVQVRSKTGRPKIKYDPDPTTHYDGPLVVLVNSGSASASEILAAALQDYHRAVIIGTSTFGKGTVQRFMDLDQAVPIGLSEVKPLGFVKFTTQKFYRINGATTQLEGVHPDITLPDNYTYFETGEKEYEYPLAHDEIEPATYDVLHDLDGLKSIVASSRTRVSQSDVFNLIDENSKWLKEEKDNSLNTLNYQAYLEQENVIDKRAERYKNISEPIPGLKILSLKADLAAISIDSVKIAQREDWISNLSKDVYLDEAISVMVDLMKSEAYAATND